MFRSSGPLVNVQTQQCPFPLTVNNTSAFKNLLWREHAYLGKHSWWPDWRVNKATGQGQLGTAEPFMVTAVTANLISTLVLPTVTITNCSDFRKQCRSAQRRWIGSFTSFQLFMHFSKMTWITLKNMSLGWVCFLNAVQEMNHWLTTVHLPAVSYNGKEIFHSRKNHLPSLSIGIWSLGLEAWRLLFLITVCQHQSRVKAQDTDCVWKLDTFSWGQVWRCSLTFSC